MMKTNFAAACVLAALLCVSGAAFAHHMDGRVDGPTKGGHEQHWQHGDWHPLGADKRELLRNAMEAAHKKNAALGKQMYDLHLDMNKVLEADKFDRAAFMADYEKIARLHAKMEQNKANAFASVAGKLTPEERKQASMIVAGGPRHDMMMRRDGKGGWGHPGKEGCDMRGGMHHGANRGMNDNWSQLNR